ncbi:hypothetical protein Asera_39080 [Actinocatenispora sera]|uniref:VOC domain-containing protein n=1 Tax=Actinocatenispora sera TaxID=390989 RepID=A0A810L2N5_9ACTN|nr:hypothetical protein Asera_39080 [Actinocatenispora sera]
MSRGALHHVELWVPDLARAARSWGWLFGELGYAPYQQWPAGRSWMADQDGYEVELVAD